MRSRTRVLVVLLLLVVVASGCNRFGREGDAGRTRVTEKVATGSRQLEDGTTVVPTTPTGPAAVATSVGPAGRIAAPTSTRDVCTTGNTASRDDASGFRVTVIVGDKSCYRRSEDITLELRMKNTTNRPLYYDPNQEWFFEVLPHPDTGGMAWSDEHCGNRSEAQMGGAVEVAPGEDEVRAQVLYPMPRLRRDREECRVLNGTYNVYGLLRWCPPESINGGVCDPAKTVTIRSAPVAIRVS